MGISRMTMPESLAGEGGRVPLNGVPLNGVPLNGG